VSEKPVSALDDMLSGLSPKLDDQAYHFITFAPEAGLAASMHNPFAMIQEDEGTTFVVHTGGIRLDGPVVDERMGVTQIRPAEGSDVTGGEGPEFARITLQVRSDLEGVGLTAAVSSALAKAGIACNVIAAFHHDHLFVPWERREEAMEILRDLSAQKG
jgi:uncharacterized protein